MGSNKHVCTERLGFRLQAPSGGAAIMLRAESHPGWKSPTAQAGAPNLSAGTS